MSCGFEMQDGSVITPMTLAHPLYSIRSGWRNKCQSLWVGWCVSSWWPWFWSIYSIYCYIHTRYYSCILRNWNKLFIRNIYRTRIGVAMMVCWMIWYCYSFLLGFKYIFHLYGSSFSISKHGHGIMWHCAVVSCTLSQSIRLFWGLRCSGDECRYVILLLSPG